MNVPCPWCKTPLVVSTHATKMPDGRTVRYDTYRCGKCGYQKIRAHDRRVTEVKVGQLPLKYRIESKDENVLKTLRPKEAIQESQNGKK